MFPKKQRVAKKKDFDLIFKKGKILHSDFFTVRFLKNDMDFRRFAVLVSKKISPKATERNRLKRILREAIRKNQKLFPSGNDYVFYVKKNYSKISFRELEKLIIKMLKNL
ncbi:MAG: ribonuclease P protein component [Parcubacteria group bacterium]|jgi:ribonuclease P protein component|nr:ribonuclease P protein component [Candidatus Moranbacteria bacterium]MDX9855586.1 ribonuclease P protein component [Candidatus Moranbacteria bacterium]